MLQVGNFTSQKLVSDTQLFQNFYIEIPSDYAYTTYMRVNWTVCLDLGLILNVSHYAYADFLKSGEKISISETLFEPVRQGTRFTLFHFAYFATMAAPGVKLPCAHLSPTIATFSPLEGPRRGIFSRSKSPGCLGALPPLPCPPHLPVTPAWPCPRSPFLLFPHFSGTRAWGTCSLQLTLPSPCGSAVDCSRCPCCHWAVMTILFLLVVLSVFLGFPITCKQAFD